MNRFLLASTALAVCAAFQSEVEEVVTVGGVRVSKSAYEADQEKPAAERQYGKLDSAAKQADVEQSVGGVQLLGADGPALAAPSAPDFTGGDGVAPTPIDPLKNAAAPVTASDNQRLVLKVGKKYKVVDGTGTAISMDGIEAGGYDTEEAAWTAIRALPH